MRRIISAFLILTLLLSLCACAPEEAAVEPKALQVGFGRVEITPKMSVPLAGYGITEKRMSLAARDPLYATCVAITDENGETVLLISQDLINSHWYKEAQTAISEKTAVPVTNIVVAGTHTHSAPDQTSPLECIREYQQDYLENIVKAAEEALEDRSEAYTYTGKTKLERMNGTRHYLMADGTYAGDNFGSFENNTIMAPAEEKDDELQIIRFAREEKQDIVMVNWQAHPAKNGSASSKLISADFVADFRNAFETTTGELCVYFTGAAGNQNPSSKLESECMSLDSLRYGQLLAEAAVKLLDNMKTPAVTQIKTVHKIYTGQVNHDNEDKLEQAKEVVRVLEEDGRTAAEELAAEYGFVHYRQANAVVNHSTMEQTRDMEISAVSIGGVSFVTAPYEMFAAHGKYIKENSPADMTFVISCCNGNHGYLPTTKAYDYNYYEAYSGNFARGTGDDLAKTFVEMLESLK